jgi:hypothetical protein
MNLFLPTVLDYNRPGIDPTGPPAAAAGGAGALCRDPASPEPPGHHRGVAHCAILCGRRSSCPAPWRPSPTRRCCRDPDLAINDGALLYNRKDADREQLLALLERA